MNKLRMLFSVVALMLAAAGVFATERLAPVYYEDTIAGNGTGCDVEIQNPPCTALSGSTCQTGAGNSVWQKVSANSDCEQLFRP